MSQTESVTDNTAQSRFELQEQGMTAIADYRRQGDRVLITHVESPIALRGKGTAGRLMTGVVELAREQGFKLTPVCSYAVAFLSRHPEFQDVVA